MEVLQVCQVAMEVHQAEDMEVSQAEDMEVPQAVMEVHQVDMEDGKHSTIVASIYYK